MSKNGQNFGLFLESLAEGHEPEQFARDNESPGAGLPWVPVPASAISYLAAWPGKPPDVVLKAPARKVRVGVLETVRFERQTYLSMLPSAEVRHNGLPMPPVAILRVGDELRVGADWLLHVSRYCRPQVGPPPKEFLGKECSCCRFPFSAGTIAYVCPECGTPVHCEDEDHISNPDFGPLECARLISECHHCHQPVVLEERHEYVPNR